MQRAMTAVAPVTCTVRTKAAPAQAFALFTERMGEWWPGRGVGAQPHAAIVVERHVGGRWFERAADGEQTPWGKVLAWEPPTRLLLGWQLDSRFAYDPAVLTEVEVTFTPLDGGGTEVRLEHRGLERFGDDAERVAGLVGSGWPQKLGGFARFAGEAP